MNEIQTVKIQGEGYLLNGTMSVPKADGNREYELIKEWLAEGNTPEPADPTPNPRIAELKSELAALDIKRIRPTAEGDTAYLTILKAHAVTLRAELQALL